MSLRAAITTMLAVLLLAGAAGRTEAAEPIIAAVEGATTVLEPDKGAVFAVTLTPGKGKISVRVVRLAVAGKQLAPSTMTARLDPPNGSGPAALILSEAAPLTEQGDYIATVSVTSSCKAAKPVMLQLAFKKPAATIKADTTLHLRRTIYGIAFGDTDSVVVSETSGLSDVHLPAGPYVALLNSPEGNIAASFSAADAKKVNDKPSPVIIPAGNAKELQLAVSGNHWPGTSQGSLALRSPDLASGIALLPVELQTRLSLMWLAILIVVGIILGYLVRDRLRKSIEVQQERLAAEIALRPLNEMIDGPPLDKEEAQLPRLYAGLLRVMNSPRASGESIKAATTAMKTELDKAVAARAGRVKAATTRLDSAPVTAEPLKGQPPIIDAILAPLAVEVAGARAALDAGRADPANDLADRALARLDHEFRPALDRWIGEQRQALYHLPTWSELASAQTEATGVESKLDDLDKHSGEEKDDESKEAHYTRLLQESASAGRAISNDILGRRARDVENYVAGLGRKLADLQPPPTATQLQPLERALEAFAHLAQDPATSLQAYRNSETTLADILTALLTELLKAYPGAAALKNTDFDAAINDIAKQQKQKMQNDEQLGVSPTELPEGNGAFSWRTFGYRGALQDSRSPIIRIIAPPVVAPGETFDIEVGLSPGSPELSPDEVSNVIWTVGGETVEGKVSWHGAIEREGETPIKVVLELKRGGSVSKTGWVLVRTAFDTEAEAAQESRIGMLEGIETFGSGVLIAAAGMVILGPSFIGTAEQLFGALLWGFTADLGIAKVVDLASPLRDMKLGDPKSPAAK